jgi:hypothetical protein
LQLAVVAMLCVHETKVLFGRAPAPHKMASALASLIDRLFYGAKIVFQSVWQNGFFISLEMDIRCQMSILLLFFFIFPILANMLVRCYEKSYKIINIFD